MHLYTARTFFAQDRLDWNRPHLRWVPRSLYRLAREAVKRRKPA
ncbi:hypothetical protein [Histidinibacterium aquaticum]|nr:hypothetical protein [Histidinibacterium aquaticum]